MEKLLNTRQGQNVTSLTLDFISDGAEFNLLALKGNSIHKAADLSFNI